MPNEEKDKWYISGPLGIGEAEPYAPLVVSGEISLKSPDSGIHSLRLKRIDEDNRTHEWAFWHMNKDYRKNALEIWEYKTDRDGKSCNGNPDDGAMCAHRLVILEGGNVGIGTAAPSAGLEIDKGATNDVALLLNSSGPGWGSGLQLKNTAQGGKSYGIYSGFGKLHFADLDAGVDRLLIDGSGNVGIGTIEPKASLHVPEGAILNSIAIGVDPPPMPGGDTSFPYPYETVGTINPGHNLRLHSGQAIILHNGNSQTPSVSFDNSGLSMMTANPLFNTGFRNTLTPKNMVKAWGIVKTGTNAQFLDGFNVDSINVTGGGGGWALITLKQALSGHFSIAGNMHYPVPSIINFTYRNGFQQIDVSASYFEITGGSNTIRALTPFPFSSGEFYFSFMVVGPQ